jgi:hypothetical protein
MRKCRSGLRAGLDWIDRHVAIFVIVGLLGLAYLGLELVDVQGRQGNDEHNTCTIQARGLPASKHLSNAMGELSAVLTPTSKTAFARVPEPTRGQLERLRVEAHAYRALEAKQPSSRHC